MDHFILGVVIGAVGMWIAGIEQRRMLARLRTENSELVRKIGALTWTGK